MSTVSLRAITFAVLGFVSFSSSAIDYADHYEFEGTLVAPFKADATGRRDVDLLFRFPGADNGTAIAWRLELLSPEDLVLRAWRGESRLDSGAAKDVLTWYERDRLNGLLPDDLYSLRLIATPLDATKAGALATVALDERVDRILQLAGPDRQEQTFPIQIGNPAKPAIVPMARLPGGAQSAAANRSASTDGVAAQSAPASGVSGYTVYLGNLHSQTNHSDGGGAVSSCTDAQNPQAGAYGPSDAYAYARNEGLDILMTSEHNHLFDGSTATNASASPTTAHNLYQSGLTAASTFNSAHSDFLAVYGMEWGVISNGGHMNIFNSPQLLEWEYNSANQLIGDVYSPKSDYASLYTQMKSNGWIGQFNHPDTSGQFTISGTDLAYTADGDSVMVLCEVTNTSAFSNNTTETETSRTSFEGACKKLLEAGYHVAFSSDQDNHCANWGTSYPNRTGVLIPSGTALSNSSFLAALKARRVFATLDKTAQIVLTANGHLMGETFSNTGSLKLVVSYAPGTGRSASKIQVYQGVPGSNGTVALLSSTATTTVTPAAGAHFYYAKITQDDGTILWSAPIWVTQGS
jgi:hypothetical protein